MPQKTNRQRKPINTHTLWKTKRDFTCFSAEKHVRNGIYVPNTNGRSCLFCIGIFTEEEFWKEMRIREVVFEEGGKLMMESGGDVVEVDTDVPRVVIDGEYENYRLVDYSATWNHTMFGTYAHAVADAVNHDAITEDEVKEFDEGLTQMEEYTRNLL